MKKHVFIAFTGLLLIAISGFLAQLPNYENQQKEIAKSFSENLNRRLDFTANTIDFIHAEIETKGYRKAIRRNVDALEDLHHQKGTILFIYENDSLKFWSHNSLPVSETVSILKTGKTFFKGANGWYAGIKKTSEKYTFYGLSLIKRNYLYQNQYLDNSFVSELQFPGLTWLTLNPEQGYKEITINGEALYLGFDKSTTAGINYIIYLFLVLLGALLFLYSLSKLIRLISLKYNSVKAIIAAIVILVGFRLITLHLGWPLFIQQIEFFSPLLYATSTYFPSLADFLINVSLLFFFTVLMNIAFKKKKFYKKGLYQIIGITGIAAAVILSYWINSHVRGLVENSSIRFDINNIFSLTIYSFTGIFIVALLYFTFFLLANFSVKFLKKEGLAIKSFLFVIAVSSVLLIIISHLLGSKDLFLMFWPIGTLIIIGNVQYRNKGEFSLTSSVFIIMLFSLTATYSFSKFTEYRERQERLVYAEKIASEDDPVAELLFVDMQRQLLANKNLQRLFEENELHTREVLEEFVQQRYFNGYWNKFNLKVNAYLPDSSAWGKLPAQRPESFREIIKVIEEKGAPGGVHPNMYQIYNSGNQLVYTIILPLNFNYSNELEGYLVFRLYAKLFPEEIGFPELLIDQNEKNISTPDNYSSARYVDGKLISHRGNYEYRTNSSLYKNLTNKTSYFSYKGYNHLIHKIDNNAIVAVSKEEPTFFDRATTFSYLCAIIGFLYLIGVLLAKIASGNLSFYLNLNNKIQILLVVFIVTGLVLFALATTYYIERQYNEKNRSIISEKIHSVLIEVQSKLDEEEQLEEGAVEYVNRILAQFSYVFFTDINLYKPNGLLLATSQHRVFDEFLISRRMNAEAYIKMAVNHKNEYIHEEQIGDLKYLSAYVPFYNQNGKLLAYINLPYFAKQSELEVEISEFLVAVVNIFVFLFILSIIFALFVSTWITRPLSLLRESLAKIELGKANRIITYKGNDEIGELVNEYNNKVAELEHNAEKLAKSERESAWREMAKQVAHEIKNPLTPMKLSVQHLQRSIEKDGVLDEQKVQRITNTLIEQIDTLTSIANAFSNFAKMPTANNKTLDILEVIENSLSLFTNVKGTNIHFSSNLPNPQYIFADKDQIIRVFNNLLKNSIQSIPNDRKGKIEITLTRGNKQYIIAVSDNGTGIPADKKDKIFVPNFTTKTRGMGLGLAMVKNIINNSGGEVWFESSESGSTFYFSIPEYESS